MLGTTNVWSGSSCPNVYTIFGKEQMTHRARRQIQNVEQIDMHANMYTYVASANGARAPFVYQMLQRTRQLDSHWVCNWIWLANAFACARLHRVPLVSHIWMLFNAGYLLACWLLLSSAVRKRTPKKCSELAPSLWSKVHVYIVAVRMMSRWLVDATATEQLARTK